MNGGELDFSIPRLGECRFPSPMSGLRFAREDERVLYATNPGDLERFAAVGEGPASMEIAGPRERIFFDPSTIACGIVTCGGLCPGLNDVIRAIVLTLYHHYGVERVFGFRYGYEGLVQRYGHEPMELTPDFVRSIHEHGGTILGSSRGEQDVSEMVDTLERLGIGILFTIGGDGTQRGAQRIAAEVQRRGKKISVIGIPKTIDNDISFVQKTFGFETAVAEARRAIYAAHTEAEAAHNGIGLVKLMGRDSGFIAAFSVLVDSQANYCLVPEVPFALDCLLESLARRLEKRGHAVLVVAEGAGQDLLATTGERDASGNLKHGDIGLFLRGAIQEHFKKIGTPINLKYIDPSYTIRSQPANAHDSALCLLMGHSAVHAGMAGRTSMLIGFWSHQFTHVPMSLAVSKRKKIDPKGWLWSSVVATTGQPKDLTSR